MTQLVDERPTPRKNPRQARSQFTVEAILEAAARILEDEGHNAFSTNAVARRAGFSIGSLYQYFPSKDAIVGALLQRESALLLEGAVAALNAPTARVALRILIAASVAHQFRRPRLARLLDFEEARLPLDSYTQAVGSKMTDVACQAIAKPDVPSQRNRLQAARDVIAITKGMIDAEGARGVHKSPTLQRRVERAVFGYLGMPLRSRPGSLEVSNSQDDAANPTRDSDGGK